MRAIKNIDASLILQSIPGLILSFIGLSLSGKKLDSEQNMAYASVFPIILLSNCMLSFKGNTELVYAMYLSSLSQSKNGSNNRYIRYAFDNACLVLSQSIAIGFSVGLLGIARNILGKIQSEYLFIRMIAMCVISSFISSLLIILILVPTVKIVTMLGLNPDNIVLPIISSVGDYIDIFALIFIIKKLMYSSLNICIYSIIIIFLFLPPLIFFVLKSKEKIPIQSISIILFSYVLSTISSYTIQYFSYKHKALASSYPIFVGLTGACSYIYLNRKITSIENHTYFNRNKGLVSVLFTSVVISAIIIIFLPIIGIHFKNAFNFLFIVGFFFTVAVLIKLLDIILFYFIEDPNMAGVVGLPVITSIADFIGCFVIMTICTIVYKK